jgi:flagellar biosynthetic protein FliP
METGMNKRKLTFVLLTLGGVIFCCAMPLLAQNAGGGNVRMPIPRIAFDITEARNPKEVATSIQVLFLLTILTLAPAIAMMMTAFTRVVIVLDFVKRAL